MNLHKKQVLIFNLTEEKFDYKVSNQGSRFSSIA